jgi:hypothetical protein
VGENPEFKGKFKDLLSESKTRILGYRSEFPSKGPVPTRLYRHHLVSLHPPYFLSAGFSSLDRSGEY